MNHIDHLISNKKQFFNYMNENYTIFQYSNLFLRDLQYAIMSYFELKESPVKYKHAEILAGEYIKNMVTLKELSVIDRKSWKINFEIGQIVKPEKVEGVEK